MVLYFGACKAVQTGSKLKGFTNLMFNLKYKRDFWYASLFSQGSIFAVVLEIQYMLSFSSQFVIKFKHWWYFYYWLVFDNCWDYKLETCNWSERIIVQVVKILFYLNYYCCLHEVGGEVSNVPEELKILGQQPGVTELCWREYLRDLGSRYSFGPPFFSYFSFLRQLSS